MSTATITRDRVRIYVTGTCDGLDRLREALAQHPELDFVGWSENGGRHTVRRIGPPK